VLWGGYCGRICAYGALTQLLDTVVPARAPRTVAVARAARRHEIRLLAVVVYFW
jgi:hypothetical protein